MIGGTVAGGEYMLYFSCVFKEVGIVMGKI